ncbi:MAG TPA: ABC transporter permease [Methanocella sp.]|nr:ABC transporter permease [Methanocella sp.]
MSRILSEIKYSLLQFARNRGSMLFILGFPMLLFLVIGFMYSTQGGPMTLYYADNDGSSASAAFVQALNIPGAVETVDGSGSNLSQMLKDGKIAAYVVIPTGFSATTQGSGPASRVAIYYDENQASSGTLINVVEQVAEHKNIQLSGASEKIVVVPQKTATSSMSMLEFSFPGILGIGIMTTAISLTVGVNAKNRARGVFRKLATTPISRIEWNLAKIATQAIVTLIAIAIALVAAVLVFGMHPHIDVLVIVLMVFGTIAFVGLGMIMAAFLKNEDTAASAASMLTFPLMFLSGAFFPVDNMPEAFQAIAAASPLTYVNAGLRDLMISGNTSDGLVNLAIVAVIAAVLFAVGVLLVKWKEA